MRKQSWETHIHLEKQQQSQKLNPAFQMVSHSRVLFSSFRIYWGIEMWKTLIGLFAMHYKHSGAMKGDLKSLIYEKFSISLVLQMITWEHLSKAVFSACMLINFCETVCIYSFQHEIKFVLSLFSHGAQPYIYIYSLNSAT